MVYEYKIIEDDAVYKVVSLVKESLGDGWRPQGGIVVYMKPAGMLGPNPRYCQAMIK